MNRELRALKAIDGGRDRAYDPVAQGVALLALLGRDPRGVWQDDSGAYQGGRFTVTVDDVLAHLKGERALGFTGSSDGRTGHWLGIDVDARWPERWPCYARVLKRKKLAQATIFTDGSRAEKSGKLVTFFEHALPLADLRRLARDIDFEARADATFGHVEKPSHVELFPKVGGTRGEGGILRIGGRHQTRGVRPERLFDSDGDDLDLRNVRPSRAYAIPSNDPKPIQKCGPQRFVRTWRTAGLPAHILDAGHHAINNAIVRLACEAYRLQAEAGDELLRRWLAEIAAASPRLASWSSPTTHDKRNPLDWTLAGSGAWKRILEARGGRSATLPHVGPVGRSNVAPSAADRVVLLLAQYCEAKGLHPSAFEVSYRQIAGWLGEPDPKQAWRIVQRAVKSGKLTLVHRGVPGEKGLKSIFGLPGSRVTPSAATARASKALARREIAMQEHARSKWQAANDSSRDPGERRKKRVALARQVTVPSAEPQVDVMAYARAKFAIVASVVQDALPLPAVASPPVPSGSARRGRRSATTTSGPLSVAAEQAKVGVAKPGSSEATARLQEPEGGP